MKRHITRSLVLTAFWAAVSISAGSAFADDGGPAGTGPGEPVVVSGLRSIPIAQILPGARAGHFAPHLHPLGGGPGGRPHCGHVIDFLARTCLMERHGAGRGALHGGPLGGPFGHPAFDPGDLELVSVSLLAEATDAGGPMIAVTFCNHSEICVRRFSISAVAVLGHIHIASPTTTVRVPAIEAGATMTVEMQLPATAMAMTPDGQALAPFDTLVVVLDSFDELIERDELNNIAILRRSEMVLVEPAVESAEPVEAVEAAPAEGGVVAMPTNPVAGPGDKVIPPPNSNIDFDQLDLGEAEETALFLGR